MSDAELVRRTLAGHKEAFEELVRRWTPRVLAVCHSKAGRYQAAEDLAQEALLRSYRALSSLAEPEKFGSWLYGIALRTCLDWVKAKERSQVTFSALGPDQDPPNFAARNEAGIADPLEEAEELGRLLDEVEQLPEKLRRVILLFYYDDLSYQDIAAMLGVSTATINARLTKARLLLRERLHRSRRL
ncbi:MAG: RNA polymerase sigma factor [Planctomycetes bacterium]|nr:RNA polymerase sigma factor [Planctomycetota bacterium]